MLNLIFFAAFSKEPTFHFPAIFSSQRCTTSPAHLYQKDERELPGNLQKNLPQECTNSKRKFSLATDLSR